MTINDTRRSEPPRQHSWLGRVGRVLRRGLLALGLMALGALGAILVLRFEKDTLQHPVGAPSSPPALETPAMPAPTAGPTIEPASEVEVMLSPEAVVQAGIKTAEVTVVESDTSVQVPGTVTANAYREVKVFPIVGGIVTKLHAELGTAVKRGAPLATLFSAGLADVQTKYLSAKAMVEAAHQRLKRTLQLAEIGAASRQELEEASAVHTGHATEAEAARERLFLLGFSRKQVEAMKSTSHVISHVVVPSPMDGIITERSANPGQVVAQGEALFVVTDLSEVWALGDLYEEDFRHVQVGSEAALTTLAYPGLVLGGRVTYIDPRVDLQTRTAKVRAEVANPQGRLRLGMYVTMTFAPRSQERVVVVPRAAVQTMGGRQVVFTAVPDEEGKFIQRSVELGPLAGELYPVLKGLQPGEVVVTEGSFFLRAESLRNAPGS
jgi:cobalt-zinc-cadmium efflux system membrane fusion protein